MAQPFSLFTKPVNPYTSVFGQVLIPTSAYTQEEREILGISDEPALHAPGLRSSDPSAAKKTTAEWRAIIEKRIAKITKYGNYSYLDQAFFQEDFPELDDLPDSIATVIMSKGITVYVPVFDDEQHETIKAEIETILKEIDILSDTKDYGSIVYNALHTETLKVGLNNCSIEKHRLEREILRACIADLKGQTYTPTGPTPYLRGFSNPMHSFVLPQAPQPSASQLQQKAGPSKKRKVALPEFSSTCQQQSLFDSPADTQMSAQKLEDLHSLWFQPIPDEAFIKGVLCIYLTDTEEVRASRLQHLADRYHFSSFPASQIQAILLKWLANHSTQKRVELISSCSKANKCPSCNLDLFYSSILRHPKCRTTRFLSVFADSIPVKTGIFFLKRKRLKQRDTWSTFKQCISPHSSFHRLLTPAGKLLLSELPEEVLATKKEAIFAKRLSFSSDSDQSDIVVE